MRAVEKNAGKKENRNSEDQKTGFLFYRYDNSLT